MKKPPEKKVGSVPSGKPMVKIDVTKKTLNKEGGKFSLTANKAMLPTHPTVGASCGVNEVPPWEDNPVVLKNLRVEPSLREKLPTPVKNLGKQNSSPTVGLMGSYFREVSTTVKR